MGTIYCNAIYPVNTSNDKLWQQTKQTRHEQQLKERNDIGLTIHCITGLEASRYKEAG
jgi:hypothetical protein